MPRYLVLICMPVALAITVTSGYAVAGDVKTTQGVMAPRAVPKEESQSFKQRPAARFAVFRTEALWALRLPDADFQ